MTRIAERLATDINGPAAIPRRNGEPIFSEPWESRIFGIAIGLCERGYYTWDEFRDCLIEEIGAADARHDISTYYERFLAALERLMLAKGICLRDEIEHYAAARSADEDQPH
jgi:nitrile hydratase accessory protein